uniref:hypothetical protein n=1 Tax=uncultured Aeromicrobium sp. TaxID=337820 RepID=UPI0025F10025
DFSFGRDGHYVAVVDVPDDSEVTIDVRADNGDDDAVLDVVLPDGGTEYNDDRRSSDPDSGNRWDPYLEFEVDEGVDVEELAVVDVEESERLSVR